MLEGVQLVCYLDNKGAKHLYIRCFAHAEPVDTWVPLRQRSLSYSLEHGTGVGTSSNIADGPSRLNFSYSVLDGCVPCLATLLEGRGCMQGSLQACST